MAAFLIPNDHLGDREALSGFLRHLRVDFEENRTAQGGRTGPWTAS
jgi:hypothetical protein